MSKIWRFNMATLEDILTKIPGKKVLYIDECGAGPLCGDLVSAGIILSSEIIIPELNDSKKVTEKKREQLFPLIMDIVDDVYVDKISPEKIDEINIRNARLLSFENIIKNIKTCPDYVIIDGNMLPKNINIPMDFLIKGDALLPGLSAASIIAKVTRDNDIYNLCENDIYAKYGLAKHKGYGTKLHLEMLNSYGPIPGFHRYSYGPVRRCPTSDR